MWQPACAHPAGARSAWNHRGCEIGYHLTGELLMMVTGIQMAHVPYSGAGPAINALLGGVTQIAFAALPPAHPFIESGALKALAVTGATRWFDLPRRSALCPGTRIIPPQVTVLV